MKYMEMNYYTLKTNALHGSLANPMCLQQTCLLVHQYFVTFTYYLVTKKLQIPLSRIESTTQMARWFINNWPRRRTGRHTALGTPPYESSASAVF